MSTVEAVFVALIVWLAVIFLIVVFHHRVRTRPARSARRRASRRAGWL